MIAWGGAMGDAHIPMEIDPGTLDPRASFELLVSCVAPRPTVFISTLSSSGELSIGPFSYFSGVSSTPPIVSVAINAGRNGKKKICQNIEETREFTISVGVPRLMEAREYRTVPAVRVKPPRLAESPIHMECTLYRTIEIEGGTTLVLGRVVLYGIDDAVMKDGQVDPRQVPFIGQLGTDQRFLVRDIFERTRR